MEEKDMKGCWLNLKNKFLVLNKNVRGKDYTYKGEIIDVSDDCIFFKDVKIGEIPISYDGLTVIEVRPLDSYNGGF